MAKVFLAGAGPGDPDLLTVKAHRILQTADVILYDSLVDERILRLARHDAELIDVGKRCGKRSTAQQVINRMLCDYALSGVLVLRLKGGDPMIFGRADEEILALNVRGIECEIIPGITAATAAAAALQRSLTKRLAARSVHFLTGHGADGGLPAHDWVALTQSGGTLAVYMGVQTVAGTASHLIEAGMPPTMPAIAIENVSRRDEIVLDASIATLPRLLKQLAPAGPVLILIGEALGVRETVTMEHKTQVF